MLLAPFLVTFLGCSGEDLGLYTQLLAMHDRYCLWIYGSIFLYRIILYGYMDILANGVWKVDGSKTACLVRGY